MKKLRFLFITLCFLTIFCLRADSAFAFKFNFYYQEVEEVYDPASTAPTIGFWEGVGNWFKGEKIEIKQSKEGGIAYKVRQKKVSSLDELYKAMGVTQEQYDNNEISNKEKALIDTFNTALSQAVTDRTEHAYRNSCDVYLVNSSDFDDTYGSYTKKDFWPCSWGDSIRLSTCYVSNTDNPDILPSTFVHEYCHTLDKSTFAESNPYGLDGSHRMDEIVTKSAAFKEAWAEYNEMIEFDSRRDTYLAKSTANTMLVIEDPNTSGDYSNKIKASDATADQLMSNEMFMNHMLYSLHELLGKDADGKDIVSNAFYATNSSDNSMSKVIKQILSDNPDKASEIYKIIDDVTLNKMTDDEMIDFCGESDALSDYLATRNGTDEEEVAAAPEATETVKITIKFPFNKWLEKLLKKHNLEKEMMIYDPKEINVIKSDDKKDESSSESVTIKKSNESTNPFQ